MTSNASQANYIHSRAYRNPVYDRPFPDPFILRFGSAYFAYSTGFNESGDGVFPLIRSFDLVAWEEVGAAMEPIESAPPLYWAPELMYSLGHFYLYYSCGNEINMELRVAVSDRPDGGFVDSGVRLTGEEFAIDPHVFIDEDGQKYLFYATDFLSHSHIGTGTVVDRMIDWFQLEGDPIPVTRAKFDWQVYDPRRVEKGNVRWHTVEGPSVLKRKKKYFEMFSGGNWKNESYGVGYAVSDSIRDPEEWHQPIDGDMAMPVLRTLEGKLVGPGHNSVISGPNHREMFCVYHSWKESGRVMSIDRMDFVDERVIVRGPTVYDQPRPFLPRTASTEDLKAGRATFGQVSPNFLLASTVRSGKGSGQMDFSITDGQARNVAVLTISGGIALLNIGTASEPVKLSQEGFDEFRSLILESNAGRIRILVDRLEWFDGSISLPKGGVQIDVRLDKDAIALNLDLTEGFVDLFEGDLPVDPGWEAVEGNVDFEKSDGVMVLLPAIIEEPGIAAKGDSFDNFEFAANIRAMGPNEDGPVYGFALVSQEGKVELQFDVRTDGGSRLISTGGRSRETASQLPSNFAASEYRQFRFVKQKGKLACDLEGSAIFEAEVGSSPSRIGIVVYRVPLAVEMVRSIRIGS